MTTPAGGVPVGEPTPYKVPEEKKEKPEKPKRPLGPYFRTTGRGLGKAFGAAGKGIWQAGAGFVEGTGIRAIRVQPREIGRAVGEATREGARAASKIELRKPEYFWGSRYKGTSEDYPSSRLPTEVQRAIIQALGQYYPDTYRAIWEPGIRMSKFVGKLRKLYPDVYEDLRDSVYSSVGTYQPLTYGYTPTQYAPYPTQMIIQRPPTI